MLLELAIGGSVLSAMRARARKQRARSFLHRERLTVPAVPRPEAGISLAANTFHGKEQAWSKRAFTISALSVGVAAVGDAFYPPLSLLSLPGTLYASRGLYRTGFWSLVRDKKATVDVLVISVNVLAIAHGYIFLLCLNSFVFLATRHLLSKIKQDARADYTDIFRQQSRMVRVLVNGLETDKSLEALQRGDWVVLRAGQTIPVDGHIIEGVATIDQRLLTGEATPVEKEVGGAVFAMTVVLSGKIAVQVEKTGEATAAANIARILTQTVDFKTGRQLRAERLADRLVWPAFVSGLLAWPLLGPGAAVALVDAHPKYKTTLATSLGMLNYFKLAAQQGILIKDGRTLELLQQVDTVVFDKTGTLTIEQPHVGQIYMCASYTAHDVLSVAAAAEQHQSHPIAKAIVQEARAQALSIPPLTEAEYKAGYGLTVRVDQRLVYVGSMRFMEMEAMAIPPALGDIQAHCHREGHSLVLVAIDGQVAGALELHTTIRPEAQRIIEGLRQRGITSIYIISGDHEVPTRRLAEALGIDQYGAETLPENKAAFIEQLQREGKVICYVGDGINDAIALKKSHVSVSLQGASLLATDTAEVILLDESLHQLCQLFDIAQEFNRNMQTTMAAVFVPSVLCVGGVLLWHFAFAQARILNVIGLVAGVGAAILPRLTQRTVPVQATPQRTDDQANPPSQASSIWASAVNSTSTVRDA